MLCLKCVARLPVILRDRRFLSCSCQRGGAPGAISAPSGTYPTYLAGCTPAPVHTYVFTPTVSCCLWAAVWTMQHRRKSAQTAHRFCEWCTTRVLMAMMVRLLVAGMLSPSSLYRTAHTRMQELHYRQKRTLLHTSTTPAHSPAAVGPAATVGRNDRSS